MSEIPSFHAYMTYGEICALVDTVVSRKLCLTHKQYTDIGRSRHDSFNPVLHIAWKCRPIPGLAKLAKRSRDQFALDARKQNPTHDVNVHSNRFYSHRLRVRDWLEMQP
jgi:hypothetical protein